MKKIKTKVCTKCKTEQDMSCFSKGNDKNGFNFWCKNCVKIYNKQYNKGNALQRAVKAKQYQEDNAPQLAEYRKKYQEDNVERLSKQKKQYYKDNKSHIKQYQKDNALFETYFEKLGVFEEIRRCFENLELLEVKCAYCGRWLIPNNSQVGNRLQAFNGAQSGEKRFYCSENCKQSCPIFWQISWPKGFKKATSREVVPLLRQLVLKRDNYTCQKCWATTETAQLHVHHEKSYTLNKIMANDPDNCITLCKECHKWVHSNEGCKYSDLRCLKDNKSE